MKRIHFARDFERTMVLHQLDEMERPASAVNNDKKGLVQKSPTGVKAQHKLSDKNPPSN